MFVPVDEISTRTLIYRQLPHLSLKITDLTVEAEIGILCYLVTDYGVGVHLQYKSLRCPPWKDQIQSA